MTCKDCVHYEACEGTPRFYDDEYIKDVTFSGDVRDLCLTFKNKADFVEVVRMDEKEMAEIKWAIELIDDYLQEPNSIAEDWYKVLKLCRQALREKVKE
jgi:hypothetical protein